MLAVVNSKAMQGHSHICYYTDEESYTELLNAPPFPSIWPRADVRNLFTGETVEILRQFSFDQGLKDVWLVKALFDEKISLVDPAILDVITPSSPKTIQ